MYHLDYNRYADQVLAAWLGKSIGGVVGAYVENHKDRKAMSAAELWPPKIPPNDDLDIQLVWLEAFQELGCWLSSEDLVRYWQDRCWYHFCEYGFFLYNVQRGIRPPWSGYWNNEYFRESEGCPIRSDIWGLVAPANPKLAVSMAQLDGELDHAGFSVEAEMFYAAMTAQAFVAKSREEIISAGLAVLPPDSEVGEVVRTMAQIVKDYPDFNAAWQITVRRYGNRDASKAITNLAFVMLAWYLCEDDFTLAMQHCVNAGWDTDCTAATLGAILGAWHGTACIPDGWRQQLGERLVCGIEVNHQNALLSDLGAETALVGAEMALTRNPMVEFCNAPSVTVRPEPAPQVMIRAEYLEVPVLFAGAPTELELTVENPLDHAVSGQLRITAAAGTLVAPETAAIRIPAGEQVAMRVRIWRPDPALPLPDKNLFPVTLIDDAGQTVAESVFGLGGARQWLVYGPYWDMWDRRKYADDCPYAGPGKNCHPGWVQCGGDSYNHYVDLKREYLPEAELAVRDIATAVPRHLESGTDLLTETDFGGWFGQACYYLTRTITAPKGAKLVLNCGRTGALKVWIDGQEVGSFSDLHAWTVGDQDIVKMVGTGKPQRLVFKLVSPSDQAALSINFLREEDHGKEGISYLSDKLIDEVPAIGYHL